MRLPTIILTFALLGQTASAQIISQTPRPEISGDEDALVETIKPQARLGRSHNTIQVPRAGALLFAGFDRNHNYIIDKAEVSAGIERAFTFADKDASGVLSLVELEGWRVAALGSEHAAPSNFAFAPNFARTVSPEIFAEVLSGLADRLDKDDQGEMDGLISLADLLQNYQAPHRAQKDPENCAQRVREERRRVEQQCRSRRY